MAITNTQMVEIANALRNESDEYYQLHVPVAEVDNIAAFARPLLASHSLANSFLSALINRIGLTIIRNKAIRNRLSIMKTGALPLGESVQEIYTNPVNPKDFDPTITNDMLSIEKPDTKVAYHRMNSQKKFPVSISEPQLRQAMISWDSLARLVESIISSLYSGLYKYEFETTKALLTTAYHSNAIVKRNITAITDEASAKAFIESARECYSLFQFPRSDMNAYSVYSGDNGVVTETMPEDIYLIITSKALATIDVEALARAFNIDKTTLLGQIVEVDDFGDDDLVAVLCDKAFCQIWDVLEELRDFENGSNLTYKYWLHKWQVYSTSLFANAVAFHTGELGELTVTSTAGTATGDTKVSATGTGVVSDNLYYKLSKGTGTFVSYDEVIDTETEWSKLTSGANIAAAVVGDNDYATVVEVDSNSHAIQAGYTELTLKE